MRIGIFGGCFNPPHKMHKKIALDLIKKDYLDKVIFVPTGNNYNKKDLISDMDRFNMLLLLVKNYENLDVDDYEFGKLTYTYQTLTYFKDKYPNDQIYFICGSDNLGEFDMWEKFEYILSNFKILVIKRGTNVKELLDKYRMYQHNIIFTDVLEMDLSSTIIRKKIRENRISELDEYLDREILNYILKYEIYQ